MESLTTSTQVSSYQTQSQQSDFCEEPPAKKPKKIQLFSFMEDEDLAEGEQQQVILMMNSMNTCEAHVRR